MEPTRGSRHSLNPPSRHHRQHTARPQLSASVQDSEMPDVDLPDVDLPDAGLPDTSLLTPTPRAQEEWERRAQRRQARRKRRRRPASGNHEMPTKTRRFNWRRLGAIVTLLVLAGATGWALTAPQMQVSRVDGNELKITDQTQIETVARRLNGQNWLRADLKSAEAQLNRVPTIENAQVARSWKHWPPRLQMTINERATWFRIGGGATWWIVDANGVAFRRANEGDESLIALSASALDISQLRAGQKLEPQIWQGARRLIAALDEQAQNGNAWSLRRVYLDKNGLAALRLQGGAHDEMLIRLGSDRWPQKLARAQQALAFFDKIGRRALALNLVSYSRPTWTPQPAESSPDDASSAASTANPNAAQTAEIPT